MPLALSILGPLRTKTFISETFGSQVWLLGLSVSYPEVPNAQIELRKSVHQATF